MFIKKIVFVLYLDPDDACVFELSIPDSPFGFLYCLIERLITGFVTRLTRRVQRVAQELLTLPEFEDTKGVIRIRVSKKNRQHNGQKEKVQKDKHTHKTKDRVTRTPLKIGGELRCSGSIFTFCLVLQTDRWN